MLSHFTVSDYYLKGERYDLSDNQLKGMVAIGQRYHKKQMSISEIPPSSSYFKPIWRSRQKR